MKTFNLKCEIVSPLHIGAGDEINPLNYIIKDERFYRISFEKYIEQMNDSERVQFEELINRGDLIALRKYISDNINPEKDCLYSIEVSPKVDSLYKAKIADINNQLLINAFIRTERYSKPFMPGSSIKGAMRTAIVSELAKKTNLSRPKGYREEYEFEARVLGYKDAKNDPFRGIKVKDKTLQKNSTVIREIRNVSKKKNGLLTSNKIQMICEISHSSITGKHVDFDTEISFDDILYSTDFLSKTITIEQIVKSCKDFYKVKMEDEHKKFYKNTEAERCAMQLLNTELDNNSFLLRMGRFSGVESVTLDNYRNPRPPQNKAVWGTTRNLAEGLYPMGWMKVTVV